MVGNLANIVILENFTLFSEFPLKSMVVSLGKLQNLGG